MESKTPQLEDGYIRIAVQLWEQLGHYRLSGEEWLVLNFVIRKTYGWQKKEDRISLSQFQEYTGLKRPHVARAIKKLVSKKVLSSTNNGTSQSTLYCLNKKYEEWVASTKKDTTSRGSTNKGTNTSTNKDKRVVPIKVHTKDTITKETKDSIVNNTANAEVPRNKDIDFILDTYKKYMGFYPTDRKPRQVAQNIKQITNSFIKRNAEKKVFVFEEIIEKAFKWYMDRDELKGETLDVFKRKMRILFDKTETKLKGGEQT